MYIVGVLEYEVDSRLDTHHIGLYEIEYDAGYVFGFDD